MELDRSRTGRRNLLLASLPAKDFALLAPQLKDIVLEQGAVLQEQGERIDQVYFPHDGIVSLLAVMRQGDAIETATIGYEGMVSSFRRTTVTVVANMLQQAGLIRYHRGQIEIVDRPGLEARACECYEAIRRHVEEVTPAAGR